MLGVGALWNRCVRWFFAHFFSLLIAAISLSQWVVIAWCAAQVTAALPPWLHLAAPAAIYALNRSLVLSARHGRRRRRTAGILPRLYYASAFTSVFCVAFLLGSGAVWATLKAVAAVFAMQAQAQGAIVSTSATLDWGFRWLLNAGLLAIASAFAYGYTFGQRRLTVTRLTLPLRGGVALAGLRIAQISDLHIGDNLDADELRRFVSSVNALDPDMVCITGDIADSARAPLDDYLPILAGLQARHGVFTILGNHDHAAGADRVTAALRRCSTFTVLRDEVATVTINGERLRVVGLDDHGRDWARGITHVRFLAGVLPAIPPGDPVIVLSHRPDVFPQAARGGAALTLAGHTHGGQLALPSFRGRSRNLAEFITRFDRGLYERDGAYLYVNSGLGVTGQRIRLCTPREITLIEVQGAEAARVAA